LIVVAAVMPGTTTSLTNAGLTVETVTGFEVARLPGRSRATAARVWEPLAAPKVFQTTV
jgi:hypothetical protein